jgi:hypothetical protein
LTPSHPGRTQRSCGSAYTMRGPSSICIYHAHCIQRLCRRSMVMTHLVWAEAVILPPDAGQARRWQDEPT